MSGFQVWQWCWLAGFSALRALFFCFSEITVCCIFTRLQNRRKLPIDVEIELLHKIGDKVIAYGLWTGRFQEDTEVSQSLSPEILWGLYFLDDCLALLGSRYLSNKKLVKNFVSKNYHCLGRMELLHVEWHFSVIFCS